MYKRDYNSYKEYVEHQKKKTSIPFRKTNLESRRNKTKIKFVGRFECLDNYLIAGRALCLGSRIGVEVEVLQDKGFDAIGIDLVSFPPYTIEGDFHDIPFEDDTFDLVFSNSVDHVHDLDKFADEIKRVLKPGGYVLFNIYLTLFGKYESLRIDKVEELISPFSGFSLIKEKKFGKKKSRSGIVPVYEIILREDRG